MNEIRALEFYSGIGGLRRALDNSAVFVRTVRAYDWDQLACRAYDLNYGKGTSCKADISQITAEDLRSLDASLWLLSPACQPYTVLNPNAKGAEDPRAASFLHLMRVVLPDLVKLGCGPKWLLIENVAGFEMSTTRIIVLDQLDSLGYNTFEALLNPLQFGIPNSRLRYYLLAKQRPLEFSVGRRDDVASPACCSKSDSKHVHRSIPGSPHTQAFSDDAYPNASIRELRCYLDQDVYEWPGHPYRIPPRVLTKWGRLFDIVLPASRRTCCFTRGYTHLVERSGSILQENEDLDTTTVFDRFLTLSSSECESNDEATDVARLSVVTALDTLRLRYFTPTELLRLFHFIPIVPHEGHLAPCLQHTASEFKWPDDVTDKAKYRLIGNSVNVEVVRQLIVYLLKEDSPL